MKPVIGEAAIVGAILGLVIGGAAYALWLLVVDVVRAVAKASVWRAAHPYRRP